MISKLNLGRQVTDLFTKRQDLYGSQKQEQEVKPQDLPLGFNNKTMTRNLSEKHLGVILAEPCHSKAF